MSKKIALIEDDTVISAMICRGLEAAGFNVRVAMDGEEGLRVIHTDKPDLILLDLLLPKKDGLSVAKELWEHVETKNIPVIILTVMEKTEGIDNFLADSGYDYAVKSNMEVGDIVKKVKDKLRV